MSEILRAYKYRIYPTLDQQEMLNQTFGCARVVWNSLVANFNAYGTDKYQENFNEKHIKDDPDRPWLKCVSAAALQQKRMDFIDTKKQFFNTSRKTRIGRMQFKNKNGRQSYRLPNQKFKLDQDNSTIRLEKIGHVRIVLDREIPETADYRNVTVSRHPSGKYFVSILVKTNTNRLPLTGRTVGIDVGLVDLLNLSSGDKINNPRWFRENQSKLKRAQHHLSRKKKGSNRYIKQRMKVARIHEKIANSREYFLHNISTSLVKQYDVICVEDLNVAGMKKNHHLSKSISDAGWSTLTTMLEYKCLWYGKTLHKIDRWYPSSQICSSCGEHGGKRELNVREWSCDSCGTVLDRDHNAATNILFKGLSDLTGKSLEETSVELIDNKRGEDVSLMDVSHHLAASVKRLDKFVDLS